MTVYLYILKNKHLINSNARYTKAKNG